MFQDQISSEFSENIVIKLRFWLRQILQTPCYLALSLIFLIALIGPWFVGDPLALSAGHASPGPLPPRHLVLINMVWIYCQG